MFQEKHYKVNLGWASEQKLHSVHTIVRALTKEIALARAGCKFGLKFPGIQIQTCTVEEVQPKTIDTTGHAL